MERPNVFVDAVSRVARAGEQIPAEMIEASFDPHESLRERLGCVAAPRRLEAAAVAQGTREYFLEAGER